MSHRSWENWLCKNAWWVNYLLWRTKTKPNTTVFYSCIITANIWESNKKIKEKNSYKTQTENKKSSNFFASRRKYSSLLKPRIPKYRGTKWKKCARKFKILQTCFAPWPHVQLILHADSKVWVFADRFSCSNFNARSFINHSKSWIQLRGNNAHYHFCFLSQK